MLKRLYVHNYKCLVNFEINFDKDISLFLGANGSGKSTIFEVLGKVFNFISGVQIGGIFYQSDITRWLQDDITRDEEIIMIIEIDIAKENLIYSYRLELILITHFLSSIHIKNETLYCNNGKIFEFDINTNTGYTGVGRAYGVYVNMFLESLRNFLIVRINPSLMNSIIPNTYFTGVSYDFSNFSAWFAHIHDTNRRGITNFENEIRNILSGYDIFSIEYGFQKALRFEFKNKSNKKKPIKYYLHELSEGQKVLIALYTLIYCTPDNSVICIDEPENFLALPEIQPWFDTLYDQCAERNLQVLLISHHPKIINFLASDSGYWFSRENNLTRVQKIVPENESGLSIAELVERGWIYEP